MSTMQRPAAKTAHTVASEYALGTLDARYLPWYAADWLAEGHDGPNLVELACLDDSDPGRNIDLLPDALADVREPVPTVDQAVDEWLDDIAAALARGEIDERTVFVRVAAFTVEVLGYQTRWPATLVTLAAMADEWEGEWGRSDAELATEVRDVCAQHVRRRPDA